MKRDSKFALLFALLTVASTLYMWRVATTAQDDANRYKLQSETNHTSLLQKQVQYEGVTNDLAHAQRDLADLQEKLAASAAREKSANARASRSRRVEPKEISGVERTSALGPLRDITMYCPTGNHTASGKWPQRGYVATMDRNIPFGTHILIEGIGELVVEDRIGSGSEFDIFTPSCSEAEQFGRQHRAVTILDTN